MENQDTDDLNKEGEDKSTENEEMSIDGRFRLKMSSDGLTANLYQLTQPTGNGQPVTLEAVVAKLSKSRIRHGIDEDAISEALAALEQGNPPEKPVPIVIGQKPVNGSDAEITWFVGPNRKKEEADTDPDSDIELVAENNKEEEKKDDGPQILLPGELVVILKAAEKGEPGMDIYGKPVRARDGLQLSLKGGEGVTSELTDRGYEYHAEWIGFLEYKNETVSVRPPTLNVSDDMLSARMDIPRHTGGDQGVKIELKHILEVMSKLGIRYGINEDAIGYSLGDVSSESMMVLPQVEIAKGTPPVHGEDAIMDWQVDMEAEDEFARVVIPGQLITECTPATKGEPGRDVHDKPIAPEPGKDVSLKMGEGVDIKTVQGKSEYRAKILGTVGMKDDKLVVNALPVQVDEDGLTAFMDIYGYSVGEKGGTVEPAHVVEVLKKARVIFGIDEEKLIEVLAEARSAEDKVVRQAVVATGTSSEHGADGSVNWYVGVEDGSQQDRLAIPGQLIAEHAIATKGEAGKDVYGKPVKPEKGSDVKISRGTGVSGKTVEGQEEFRADSLGFVAYEKGKLVIESLPADISGDALTATMTLYGRSGGEHGGKVEAAHVIDALTKAGVKHGVHEEDIERSLTEARASAEGKIEQAEVAHGTPAVHGENGKIAWQVDIDDEEKQSRVVLPWQLIAIHTFATKGKKGTDVLGRDLRAIPGEKAAFEKGAGIEVVKVDDGEEYRAISLGVAEKVVNKLVVFPPGFKISDDGLTANLDLYAVSGGEQSREIELKHIKSLLEECGIVYGIEEEVIVQILDHLKKRRKEGAEHAVERGVVVAKGDEKHDGVPAKVEIDYKSVPGVKLKNGRIDLHERGYPWDVKENMVLGKFTQAIMAIDGMKVNGEVITAKTVEDVTLDLTAIQMEDNGVLISQSDGSLLVNDYELSVSDVVIIRGDVGARTGNLRTKSTVQVKGYVTTGFMIEALGDVIVDENVEDAVIRSGGNVIIRGGVRGTRSQIYAAGNITLGFVEYGKIIAKNNIEILRSAVDANIVAGADLHIGPEPGTILAGKCEVIGQVWAVGIGHEASSACEIQLGLSKEKIRRLHILQDKEKLSTKEKKERDYLAELAERAEYSALRVKGEILSDVALHIGSQNWIIQDKISYRDFYIDPEKHKITFRAYDEKAPIPRAHKPSSEDEELQAEALPMKTA